MKKLYLFLTVCIAASHAYGQCPVADAGPPYVEIPHIYVPTSIGPEFVEPNASYSWTPTQGLSGPNQPNPSVWGSNSIITYTLTVRSTANMIVNGDFELGNTGFVSDYTYIATRDGQPGLYGIVEIDNQFNPRYCGLWDHTLPTRGGNMMVVDGSTSSSRQIIWKQDVSIDPSKRYDFGLALATASYEIETATVAININGNLVYKTKLGQVCDWNMHQVTSWNPRGATTASIEIYLTTTHGIGNDLVIDDIFLREHCEPSTATVTVEAGDVIYSRRAAAESDADDIAIYPNPADGNFTIQFKNPSDEAIELTVRDSYGNVVLTSDNQKIQSAGDHSINLQGVPEGVYILSVRSAKGVTEKKLVVKK